MNRTRRLCVAALAVLLAALAGRAGAQEPPREGGLRLYEEELRVRMDEQGLDARDTGVDGGGWFNFAYYHFDDASTRRDRTLRQFEVRAWATANIEGVHKAYVRGLVGWEDWNSGDNDYRGDRYHHPTVERAWYQFDLGQLLKNQSGLPPPADLRVKVGREYVSIGTGLVLAMPLDMVQINAKGGHWEAMAILGQTIDDSRNIDNSSAVYDHQDRCLWAGQVTYTGLDHHRPFAYFLAQQDRTGPRPVGDPNQGYGYSSRYLGLGSTGTLAVSGLRYRTELVWESGETVSNGVGPGRGTDEICAWGLDAMLEYLWNTQTRPRFMVEYLFGSGDADRSGSATATVGGNREGTTDHAFNTFGYRDTGIAFAPDLSNLSIYAAGAAFQPLEHIAAFRKMTVGTKAFFYQKAEPRGALSDPTGTGHSSWVGWEWDAYCDWRLTSDFSWTIRYGAFFPGEAFTDQTCRQFLFTAITFSF